LSLWQKLLDVKNQKGAGFWILIDPEDVDPGRLPEFVNKAKDSDVDAFLVGASTLNSGSLDDTIKQIKNNCDLPVIIFPGSSEQVSEFADGILFLTLISSRNPDYLISEQVKGAPLIKSACIEPIATGYILVESGKVTTVQSVSNSEPIPSDNPEYARSHALAAQYMGMKAVYLEAGSGALNSVPQEIVTAVNEFTDIPIIVGGGIRTPQCAREKVIAGASFVVVGNHFEQDGTENMLGEFAEAIHTKLKCGVSIE